mgnify:CR=1 FL=1
MNIRVLLCTAGIAAVQVLSAIELTGQGRNEMPVGFPRNANPFGGTSRGIFYSGQFPYGYSLWSRGA